MCHTTFTKRIVLSTEHLPLVLLCRFVLSLSAIEFAMWTKMAYLTSQRLSTRKSRNARASHCKDRGALIKEFLKAGVP